jgi:sulfur carrier protein ThiS
MTEWLDPSNLEDPESTTQDLLDELSFESDQVAAQVQFWPVGAEVGNVRNNGESLIKQIQ